MKPKIFAAITVALVVAGWYFYFYKTSKDGSEYQKDTVNTLPQESPIDTSKTENSEVTLEIKNFDECVASGNKPLNDSPDKCLTPDGHLFIKGVEE